MDTPPPALAWLQTLAMPAGAGVSGVRLRLAGLRARLAKLILPSQPPPQPPPTTTATTTTALLQQRAWDAAENLHRLCVEAHSTAAGDDSAAVVQVRDRSQGYRGYKSVPMRELPQYTKYAKRAASCGDDTGGGGAWVAPDGLQGCVANTVAELGRYKAGDVVLDFGSGCGFKATYWSAMWGVAVLGVDVTGALVEWANRHAGGLFCRVPPVGQQQRQRILPWLPDNSVSHVHSFAAMYYVQPVSRQCDLVQDMLRVVKPGGSLYLGWCGAYRYTRSSMPCADPASGFWEDCLGGHPLVSRYAVLYEIDLLGTAWNDTLDPGRYQSYRTDEGVGNSTYGVFVVKKRGDESVAAPASPMHSVVEERGGHRQFSRTLPHSHTLELYSHDYEAVQQDILNRQVARPRPSLRTVRHAYRMCVVSSLLKQTLEALESCHIVHWVDQGTLLGLWRHGGFMPWDQDADVAVLLKPGALATPARSNSKAETAHILQCFRRASSFDANTVVIATSKSKAQTGIAFKIDAAVHHPSARRARLTVFVRTRAGAAKLAGDLAG